MRREELLSVVVPVYNTAPDLLARSVESLLAQTYKTTELILVDDGSCTETKEKLASLAAADSRIRIIHQENRGASAARNAGIRVANGRFLTMFDADDVIAPEAYARSIERLLCAEADVCVFGFQKVSLKQKQTSGFRNNRDKKPNNNSSFFPAVRGRRCAVETPDRMLTAIAAADTFRGGGYPWNKVWDLKQIGTPELFREDLFSYEDKLWCIQMYLKCRRILLMPECWYSYYQTEGSLSRVDRKNREKAVEKRRNALAAYEAMLEIMPKGSTGRLAAWLFQKKIDLMGILKRNKT